MSGSGDDILSEFPQIVSRIDQLEVFIQGLYDEAMEAQVEGQNEWVKKCADQASVMLRDINSLRSELGLSPT